MERHIGDDHESASSTTPGRRPAVAMLIYPGMTLLDLVGPHAALAWHADIDLVATSMDEVLTDSGIPMRPTTTLDECRADVDVLFVPGGAGVPGGPNSATISRNEDVLAFLESRAAEARYVTAVCSGSLVLGAAGLLRGYRAATHWASQHQLPLFGAIPVDERVVIDRNRITGGGVTAGLDFGLALLGEMFDDDVAKTVQLALEYDPAPPLDTGSPVKAGPELTRRVRGIVAHVVDDTAEAAAFVNGRGWGANRDSASQVR
ncbi:MAG: DJ-1/PfpI family protein [Dermatophilaceae bacterium]